MVALRSKKSIEQEHPAKALRNALTAVRVFLQACYAGSDDLPPLQCLVTKQRAHALNVERTHLTTVKDTSPREQSMSPSTYTLLVSAPEVLTAKYKMTIEAAELASLQSQVLQAVEHCDGYACNLQCMPDMAQLELRVLPHTVQRFLVRVWLQFHPCGPTSRGRPRCRTR